MDEVCEVCIFVVDVIAQDTANFLTMYLPTRSWFSKPAGMLTFSKSCQSDVANVCSWSVQMLGQHVTQSHQKNELRHPTLHHSMSKGGFKAVHLTRSSSRVQMWVK